MKPKWSEQTRGIHTLQLGSLRLAVYRPSYNRDRWCYSINSNDSNELMDSLEEAQEQGLIGVKQWIRNQRSALEQIELALNPLIEGSQFDLF